MAYGGRSVIYIICSLFCEALFHYYEQCVTQHSVDLHGVTKLVY